MEDNSLDFELAKSVGEYFQLTLPEMNKLIKKIKTIANTWDKLAKELKISKKEQEIMEGAFYR